MIRTALLTASLLVLAALFYVTVIVIHPRGDGEGASVEALSPRPSARVTDVADLNGLIRDFPTPVLAVQPAVRIELTEGVCEDAAYEKGIARVMTLRYALPEGGEITVTSVYPLEAVAVLGTEGWHLLSADVPSIGGMQGMALQKGASLRMLYENGDTLYSVEGTETGWETLTAAVAVMQLYQ